jgi:hypothetical protein
LLAAASRRIFPLHPDPLHTRSRRFQVDDPGVSFVDKLGPGGTRTRGLPDNIVKAGPGKLDGFQIVGAKRFGGAAYDSLRVLLRSGSPRQNSEEWNYGHPFSDHAHLHIHLLVKVSI